MSIFEHLHTRKRCSSDYHTLYSAATRNLVDETKGIHGAVCEYEIRISNAATEAVTQVDVLRSKIKNSDEIPMC